MREVVTVPVLGDVTRSVVVREWLHSSGERVEAGDLLVTVETDKVTVDVPSPIAGRIVEQLASPDDEIPTGAPLCVIEGEIGGTGDRDE